MVYSEPGKQSQRGCICHQVLISEIREVPLRSQSSCLWGRHILCTHGMSNRATPQPRTPAAPQNSHFPALGSAPSRGTHPLGVPLAYKPPCNVQFWRHFSLCGMCREALAMPGLPHWGPLSPHVQPRGAGSFVRKSSLNKHWVSFKKEAHMFFQKWIYYNCLISFLISLCEDVLYLHLSCHKEHRQYPHLSILLFFFL